MIKDLIVKKYPGRIIIIGKDISGKNIIVAYAITARSAASQARRIDFKTDRAVVEPTNEKILERGDPDLLVYPCIQICQGVGIAVSNGRQTPHIAAGLSIDSDPAEILAKTLNQWNYEPDAPNYTPRISGCVLSPETAALSLIKRTENGLPLKNYFCFSLLSGQGRMVSTYSGENISPLPSFKGEPESVDFEGRTPDEVGEEIYEALGPEDPSEDFRVAVACLFAEEFTLEKIHISIINRQERIE